MEHIEFAIFTEIAMIIQISERNNTVIHTIQVDVHTLQKALRGEQESLVLEYQLLMLIKRTAPPLIVLLDYDTNMPFPSTIVAKKDGKVIRQWNRPYHDRHTNWLRIDGLIETLEEESMEVFIEYS